MVAAKFFDEITEQSRMKAKIVEYYFDAWANIIVGTQKARTNMTQRIGYFDLFAGPGRYGDGTVSTPIKVLQKAVSNSEIAKRLVTVFNDNNQDSTKNLLTEINQIVGIKELKHKPEVWSNDIDDEFVQEFSKIKLIPALAFIDPWGYKGLSNGLLQAFVKDWGCDCIFFFNYGRINAGINNDMVRGHMNALFGEHVVDDLRGKFVGMESDARESLVIETLARTLIENSSAEYVLPFCFKNSTGVRTSHHIVFVSKNFKGYEVMKEIMAKASHDLSTGVGSFQFSPAANRQTTLLFELNKTLEELKPQLLIDFRGQTLAMANIYKAHCVGTPFIKANYKKVLRELEDVGKVKVTGRKSKQGFADHLLVEFPN